MTISTSPGPEQQSADFDPSRAFRVALDAPPQQTPDNLHAIATGPSLTRLRDLVVGMRMDKGPILVVAGDRSGSLPPPGIPIHDLDLSTYQVPRPFRYPAYRRLCEIASGDLKAVVEAAWYEVRTQEIEPGTYRQVVLHPSAKSLSFRGLTTWCERTGIPAPEERGTAALCLVTSLEDLRELASIGWRPGVQTIRLRGTHPTDFEDGLGDAYASSTEVVIPGARITLAEALTKVDPVRGSEIWQRISESLTGSLSWSPWAENMTTLIVSSSDDLRLSLVLERCLDESISRMRHRDSAVRTIIIDTELLSGMAAEVGHTIARTGRKSNCTCVLIGSTLQVPGWSDQAGFTIREEDGKVFLATDQDYETQINQTISPTLIARAHAVLHRQQGDT